MGDAQELVADGDRDQTVASLRDHLLAGRLTLEEFSERVERAYRARMRVELARVEEGLPAADDRGRAARRKPTRITAAFFSHIAKRGKLRLRRRTMTVSAFSDLDLDLRDAELDSPEVSLTMLVAMGNVDVYVPDGVGVEVGGISLFGHRRDWGRELERPDAPMITVRVLSVFGTVDVWRVPADLRVGYAEIFRALQGRQRELKG